MLDFDPNIVPIPCGHFIDGALVSAPGALDVRRPYDGAAYAALPCADLEAVDRAVRSAATAFSASGWGRRAPRDRARVLRRWAELIETHAGELARLESVGSTRPVAQATGWDVPTLAETLRFFSELADKHGGEVAATQHDRLGMTLTEPYGVVGAIVPWNYPLVMAGWKVAPALAAGNAVVLKPSEMTPFSVVRFAELGIEAGLPAGIFNIVQGDGATTGEQLVRHPNVAKMTFTGSTRAGQAIMAACAQQGPKPVTLELGGKSPQLVFADADLDLAATCIASSMLGNAGQTCVTGSRLILHESIRDALVARIVEKTRSIVPGPTWSGATNFPPIISDRQHQRVDALVQETIRSGAEVVLGGHALDEVFYAPTILAHVHAEMPAVREEVFGPVLTVQSFADEDDGIALASHPIYGLAAGVYSRDISQALRAVRRLESGTVWVNRYGRSDDFVIPTGGYKQSGFGKDLGREAFAANQRVKSVLIGIGA